MCIISLHVTWHIDYSSQKVIETLNKSGVLYKPDKGKASEGEEDSKSDKRKSKKYYADGSGSGSSEDDDDAINADKTDFDCANYVTPLRRGNMESSSSRNINKVKGSRANPFVILNNAPYRSLRQRSSSSLSANAISTVKTKLRALAESNTSSLQGNKRKRKPSSFLKSPYLRRNSKTKHQKADGNSKRGKLIGTKFRHVNY